MAFATDAFAIPCSNRICYAFPPFSLISRVLSTIQRDKASVLLITPVWPTLGWHPILLQLLVDLPLLLPRWSNLLVLPPNRQLHPLRDCKAVLCSLQEVDRLVLSEEHP